MEGRFGSGKKKEEEKAREMPAERSVEVEETKESSPALTKTEVKVHEKEKHSFGSPKMEVDQLAGQAAARSMHVEEPTRGRKTAATGTVAAMVAAMAMAAAMLAAMAMAKATAVPRVASLRRPQDVLAR